jgi:hypothetical protein
MADVYAVFGTLIALGIAYPGMLAAWRLLFPDLVQRAQERIAKGAWGSLGIGVVGAVPIISLSVVFLSAPGGVGKFIGLLIAVIGLGIASLGASGLAAGMGVQLNEISGGKYSIPGAHLRGAVALELAAIFPLIGWLIVFPLTTLACFGAALRALFSKQGSSGEAVSHAVQA